MAFTLRTAMERGHLARTAIRGGISSQERAGCPRSIFKVAMWHQRLSRQTGTRGRG